MPVDDSALGALATVRNFCRWHVWPSRDEEITLDGSGSYLQLLPSLKVTAIASVVEDGKTLIVGTDFDWSENGELVRLGFRPWTCKRRAVVVTLTHGWVGPEPPDDVSQVLSRVAVRAASDTGTLRQTGHVIYGVNADGVSPAGSLTGADEKQLMPYRIALVR